MDRLSYITIAGRRLPMNFSVAAAEAVTEKWGGVSEVGTALSGKVDGEDRIDTAAALNAVIWLISLLTEQGAAYMRIMHGDDSVQPWTEQELKIVINLGDLAELKGELLGAMTKGMSRTVETAEAEDSEKNATATQDN